MIRKAIPFAMAFAGGWFAGYALFVSWCALDFARRSTHHEGEPDEE